jgi:methionyl-tRNA synthetase
VPYFLSRYDPDALRFYLTATAPETRDTEFSWEDFVERNNWVLSVNEGTSWSPPGATCANARRYTGELSFAYKRFDGRVPEPGFLDADDQALLDKVEAGFQAVGALYDACRFRAAKARRCPWPGGDGPGP